MFFQAHHHCPACHTTHIILQSCSLNCYFLVSLSLYTYLLSPLPSKNKKADNDDELGKTYFNEPIDEDKLNKWEEANGVKIPETYKEWLRFTEKSLIDGSSAMFWGTDDFHHNFMPDNLTVIGEMSGDGEVVCFSNDNGEFMGYYEGDITYRTNDFSQVIDQIFERNSAWGGMSKEAMELFMKFCEEE